MKAISIGLETTIKNLNQENIKQMHNDSIRGILYFRDIKENRKKKIPFELRVVINQKAYVDIQSFPEKAYFGNAEKIIFKINKDYYELLKEKGIADGGRLRLCSREIYCY